MSIIFKFGILPLLLSALGYFFNSSPPTYHPLDNEFSITQAYVLIEPQDLFGSWKGKMVQDAREKSENVKGVYLTNSAASARGYWMLKLQREVKELLDTTELNSVVMDVKEVEGFRLSLSLKAFLDSLRSEGYWTIARIVVFRDCSLIKEHQDWYLRTLENEVWRDAAGGCWLNPASVGVQEYIIKVAKKTIDFGFDELQFDYLRFPEDYYSEVPKYEIIGRFSDKLAKELKEYRPQIMLSIDIFGYVATQLNAFDIGQRLEDAARNFDYISFMLYPSHFYGGFRFKNVYLPYEDNSTSTVVSSHPKEVVYYSVVSAIDYISAIGSKAKVRPWLQGFDLRFDTQRGIFYDATAIKTQIEAAQASGASGWLIWNPENIYPKEAFATSTRK